MNDCIGEYGSHGTKCHKCLINHRCESLSRFTYGFDFETYPSDKVVMEYMASDQYLELKGTLTRDSVAVCFIPDDGQLPPEWKKRYEYAIDTGEYPDV
jgi:hypothetical protein